MANHTYNYQVYLETKRNYTLDNIKDALYDFIISEQTPDYLRLDFDGWELSIRFASGDNVKAEAGAMADLHHKPVIAECSSRLEISVEYEQDETADEHPYLIEKLKDLAGVHIYDVSQGKFIFEKPETPDTSFLQRVEDDDEIASKLKHVLQYPNDWHDWHSLGVAYGKAKMHDLAIRCYENSVLLNPQNAVGYYNLACDYKDIYNDVDKAETYFRKAMEINPLKGYYPTCVGRVLARKGQKDEALKYMFLGAEIEPGEEFCNMTLGFYLLLYGDPDRALHYAEKAISQGEIHISSLNKAHVHLIRGERDKAVETYAKSLRAFPTETHFWIDFDSDYEVMPQYGISLEYYNSLKEEIKEKVATLPELELNEIVGLLAKYEDRSKVPITEAQIEYLRSLGIPEAYINWLKISNRSYEISIPGFPKASELNLMHYDGLLNCIYDEGSYFSPISSNGYFAFATNEDGDEFIFDVNDGVIRLFSHDHFYGITNIYEDALASGELTAEEVFEHVGDKVYRVKSDYIKEYLHKHCFKRPVYQSFEELLDLYLKKMQEPQVKQQFPDTNFKIAVIGALHEMGIYTEEARSLHDRYREEDEPSTLVPEVCQFYWKLEIDREKLALIETFCPDADNDCYRFAMNGWDESETVFDIRSITGIGQLENLKVFHPEGLVDTEGISYRPLLQCSKLERVNAAFMEPTDENFEVMDQLRARGVEILNMPHYIEINFLKDIFGNEALEDVLLRVRGNQKRSWKVWHQLGYHYSVAGENELSERCYANSLLLNPENNLAYFNMGKDHYKQRNFKLARQFYEKSLEIDPDHAPSWESLGQVAAREGNQEEALALLEKGVEVDPHDVGANTNLAFFLIKYGQADRALFYAERAFFHGIIYTSSFNKGHLLQILGKTEEAIDAYAISLRAAKSESHFWSDYEADFELMPQYGITKAQYDALKPAIEERLENLPPLQLNEIASLWESCASSKQGALTERERERLIAGKVPEAYIEWLSVANWAYDTNKLSHPPDYRGIHLKDFKSLIGDVEYAMQNETEDLLLANGYLPITEESANHSIAYVLDLSDDSVREIDSTTWIRAIDVYENHYGDEIENGQLDLKEVYEDPETKEDYKPKSKYVRQFLDEYVFTGVRFDSFLDFLQSHVNELKMEN